MTVYLQSWRHWDVRCGELQKNILFLVIFFIYCIDMHLTVLDVCKDWSKRVNVFKLLGARVPTEEVRDLQVWNGKDKKENCRDHIDKNS